MTRSRAPLVDGMTRIIRPGEPFHSRLESFIGEVNQPAYWRSRRFYAEGTGGDNS
jgi:hypothetical protein